MPSVLPRSSGPMNDCQRPSAMLRFASTTLRATASNSAKTWSATACWFAPAAMVTSTSWSRAASRSMRSKPTPRRETTRNRGARSSTSRVTWAEPAMYASASASSAASSSPPSS